MELSPKQQINELIKNNQNILIVSHKKLGGDALGAMLALEKVLAKLEKNVSIISSENIDKLYDYLPGLDKIKSDILGTRDLIIRLDTDKTPLEKLSYNQEERFVNVVISPKKGKINQSDIEFIQGNFKFDLIFVLDTPDVEKIDKVYDQETELFFETPIINIDHHAGNEYFGTVNLVDLTATSTCEILVSVIESFGTGHFDEDVATCLLTGIIADTESYKNINTTPKSLTISAQMLAAGARQQEIISNLYKTQTFDSLKLWGKILSKLEYNQDLKTAISTLSRDDLNQKQINFYDVRVILENSLAQIPNSEIVLVLAEIEPNKIQGLLKSFSSLDALKITSNLGGTGDTKMAEFGAENMDLKTVLNKLMVSVAEAQGKPFAKNNSPIMPEKTEKFTEKPKEIVSDSREYLIEETAEDNKETVLVDFPEDPISKAIESIDEEIEERNGDTANVDIEDAKNQNESLKPLGNILENHQPGTALEDDKDKSHYSPNELNGQGDQNNRIETWKPKK